MLPNNEPCGSTMLAYENEMVAAFLPFIICREGDSDLAGAGWEIAGKQSPCSSFGFVSLFLAQIQLASLDPFMRNGLAQTCRIL